MTTNTGHKYISQLEDGRYVVRLPDEVSARFAGKQCITRKELPKALYMRNLAFGYDPDKGEPTPSVPEQPMTLCTPNLVRIGALGDTHLGSNYEDLPALHKFYDELAAEGITTVFHAGNWVDGDKFMVDVHTWGVDNQIRYFLENYPQRPGIKTYILDGDDHEGWWYKSAGVVPGKLLQDRAREMGRDDLLYLGYMEADVILTVGGRDVRVKVVHGGGGSSKSISLASQNIIDNRMTNAEAPDLLIVGHYHKAHFLPNYRGVFACQTGCFESQTPFMRGKNLMASIGGWVLELFVGADNRLRVGATYHSYKPHPWTHAPIRVGGGA